VTRTTIYQIHGCVTFGITLRSINGRFWDICSGPELSNAINDPSEAAEAPFLRRSQYSFRATANDCPTIAVAV
jgi:hypothetical protein